MADKTDNYFYALGRRKSATARVRISKGTGTIHVNEKSAEEYFADSKYLLAKLNQPFTVLGTENTYTITAHVSGGGHDGQIEAIRLGIAKALTVMDENLKTTLKRADLLGRDSREKERKKFGLKGARKQRQFTKR
ncbi:MAG TPA: 30S ribosomal protein S9 [Candidatus Saccharimonadales bacterium]|jgi:small subunit ribosomal protein S9